MIKKIRKILFYIVLAFLVSPTLSYAYEYTRTPSGSEVTVPVTFHVKTDSYLDYDTYMGEVPTKVYLAINNTGDTGTGEEYQIVCLDYSDEYTQVVYLPIGETYGSVYSVADNDCIRDDALGSILLEGTGDALFYTIHGGFMSLIASAQAGFASTTGFSMASVVTWSGDNLIKLFIGSGLAILYELRYWIVALIVIGALVYFAFRYYKNKKKII